MIIFAMNLPLMPSHAPRLSMSHSRPVCATRRKRLFAPVFSAWYGIVQVAAPFVSKPFNSKSRVHLAIHLMLGEDVQFDELNQESDALAF
jgi:hypothetical protein